MANMSYCRFENTVSDLADCVMALKRVVYDGEAISEREWAKAKSMLTWCQTFIDTFEEAEESELNIEK